MFVLKAITQTMIDYIGVEFYRATLIKEANIGQTVHALRFKLN